MLTRKAIFAAKIEATPGTAESLGNSDGAFNAQQLMLEPTTEMVKREAQGRFARKTAIAGGIRGTYSFRTDLSWDGTATLPTWVTTLLAGCGWVNSSGTVTPRTEEPGTNVKTLTLGKYIDGVYERLAGCMGTARIQFETGRPTFIDWTFEGKWVTATDTALITPTFPTVHPIRYAGATTTFNSVALCLSRCTIDLGNTIYLQECASDSSGYSFSIVQDREPTITADPGSRLVASQDRYGMLHASTEAEFSLTLAGFATNATIEFSAPKAQLMSVKRGDREGLSIDNLVFACNENTTADQELILVFTEAT
jgi:hypothetical protein